MFAVIYFANKILHSTGIFIDTPDTTIVSLKSGIANRIKSVIPGDDVIVGDSECIHMKLVRYEPREYKDQSGNIIEKEVLIRTAFPERLRSDYAAPFGYDRDTDISLGTVGSQSSVRVPIWNSRTLKFIGDHILAISLGTFATEFLIAQMFGVSKK